ASGEGLSAALNSLRNGPLALLASSSPQPGEQVMMKHLLVALRRYALVRVSIIDRSASMNKNAPTRCLQLGIHKHVAIVVRIRFHNPSPSMLCVCMTRNVK